jgi:hypothetical protein
MHGLASKLFEFPVIASAAKQSSETKRNWIAALRSQ